MVCIIFINILSTVSFDIFMIMVRLERTAFVVKTAPDRFTSATAVYAESEQAPTRRTDNQQRICGHGAGLTDCSTK